MTPNTILCGDNLTLLRELPDKCVDLVFTSPPYEAARTYGVGFALKGQEWVDWAVERFVECLRVSKGLVAWNIEGQTRQFRWSATPALFMADLHRRGVHLRKPPIFKRVGIPGSGGPDWLRNDYEFIVCATSGGKLPFSNNTAMGHPPKWAPGGEMSNRLASGSRVNRVAPLIDSGAAQVDDGGVVRSKGRRPSHELASRNQWGGTGGKPANRKPNGERDDRQRPSHSFERLGRGHEKGSPASQPVLANPGNVVTCKVGGGVMGSRLCHENEAPFPEALAEFFIRSFCPVGGIVLDPHCGSGTTLAVAEQHGRQWIGMDVRQSQVDLSYRRVAEVKKPLFGEPNV